MPGFAMLVALCFVPVGAAETSVYRWKTEKDSLSLMAGESFAVKYRIIVHPGPGDKTALEKEYQGVAK